MEALFSADQQLFELLNALAGKSRLVDIIFVIAAEWIIVFLVLFLVFCFFIWPRSERFKVITALIAAALARLVFVSLFHFFLFRSRPFVGHPEVVKLIAKSEVEGSFPSGHASIMFAIAWAVYAYNKGLGLIVFILAFISSMARVIAGVHFPLDVVGGFVVGGIAFYSASYLVLKSKKWYDLGKEK